MKHKYFANVMEGWRGRLKAQGISMRQFCLENDLKYETFRRLKNPRILLCDKIEAAIRKLED